MIVPVFIMHKGAPGSRRNVPLLLESLMLDMMDGNQMTALRISLASPEQIRAWSSGEVTSTDTLHYETRQPDPDGLFSERIFGPTRDFSCACGRYKRERFAGRICEKCGVQVTTSAVRRERMGHIELATPVAHPWYARRTPNTLALLLNLSPRQLSAVLSSTGYLVTHIDEEQRARILQQSAAANWADDLSVGDVLTEEQYQDKAVLYGPALHVCTGARGLRAFLATLDLDALSATLQAVIRQAEKPAASQQAARRLAVVEALRSSQTRPEWMLLTVLPVLPPDLRPLVPLPGDRVVSSDLNTLYKRVLHRNNHLKRMQALDAPALLVRNEERLLQVACDALFDNGHLSHPICGSHGQPLKSLTELISGKGGHFRHFLLGKRVDYSGRSVITAGLDLTVDQCGLPSSIARELFKPFVIRKLLERNHARTARHAKQMVEQGDPFIYDLLEECMYEKVVLLNRAPTLHRLSIQAFYPRLIEGNAIQLHPLVCSAFNADFDGDQMAVHLPLSDEAQQEARTLLLSTRNLRGEADGTPSISLSQEIVLGLFYLTQNRPSKKRASHPFADPSEVEIALSTSVIDLHTPITIRGVDHVIWTAPPPAGRESGSPTDCLSTTAGRLLFNAALPEGLRFRNYAMTKERLKQLVSESLVLCGEEATAHLCDTLKRLGFTYATKSGISFAMSDMKLPTDRLSQNTHLIEEAQAQVTDLHEQVTAGLITSQEWADQVIALWTQTTEQVSRVCEASLDPFGTLATIMQSGATKAKPQQIRQLNGIRGLMASPSGRILPLPILGNYLTGLRVWELFTAASGARKGFMDRSLNTAMCGDLTRKLVEAGMEVWITMQECGTSDGILITNKESRELGLPDMRSRLVGRSLAEAVGGVAAGVLLDEQLTDQLLSAGVTSVRVRSPLTCQASYGICQRCYGWDIAQRQLVRGGTAVGIIAGQSVGEPGTQLTMRTFHSGGIANAQGDITQGLPKVIELFEVRPPRTACVLAELAGRVQIDTSDAQEGERIVRVHATHVYFDEYTLPRGSIIRVEEQASVARGQLLAIAPSTTGTGQTLVRARTSGLVDRRRDDQLLLRVEEPEKRSYAIPIGRPLAVTDGQHIEIGTPLTIGSPHPQDVLRLLGRDAAQRYLVNEVQRVYRTTGVSINDKHVECIVRQMLRFVQVDDPGDTSLLPGQVVDRGVCEAASACMLAQGGAPAKAHVILLGLSRAILQTTSWLAAASFQQTSRVLAEAAIRGQRDDLCGYKQSILLGRRIPTNYRWPASSSPVGTCWKKGDKPVESHAQQARSSNNTSTFFHVLHQVIPPCSPHEHSERSTV